MQEEPLAQVVVDREGVTLYYVGKRPPERIAYERLQRLTVSLRDPAGPLVWIEDRAAANEKSTEETTS